jgi:hypothetical protein
MRFHRGLRVAAFLLWLSGSGCTALREIPRGEYAAQPQRDHVRIVTRDGLLYEFDYATFQGDSIVGFKRREDQTHVADYASLGMPLEQVSHLATRQVDWVRTSLVGGVGLLVVLVGAYKASQANNGGTDSGGGGGRPPPG